MGEAVTKAPISHGKKPSRRPLLPQNAIKRRFNRVLRSILAYRLSYHPVAEENANTQAKIKTSEGIGSGMRAQGKEVLPYGVDLQGRPSRVNPFSGPHRDTTLQEPLD